jgi:hypothetical protein
VRLARRSAVTSALSDLLPRVTAAIAFRLPLTSSTLLRCLVDRVRVVRSTSRPMAPGALTVTESVL